MYDHNTYFINRIFWNVTLDDITHLLTSVLFSREDTHPRLTFLNLLIRSLLMES